MSRASLPGQALEHLEAEADVLRWHTDTPPTADELASLGADAHALITLTTDPIGYKLISQISDLIVVSNVGVGYDNLDLTTLTSRGIPAGNTPGVLTETTADLAWALILAACRRVVEGDRYVHHGQWIRSGIDYLLGQDVYHRTLGILGYGAIGKAVARRGRGFDMPVIHHSRSQSSDDLSQWVPLDDLLARSDIVSVHTPLSDETRHLIGERELRLMKETAVLVNTSRGGVIDQRALARALSEGWIFAAGLDVTSIEPIPLDDPLLSLPNAIILPHIGSASFATRSRMVDLAVANIVAGLRGERLPHCVNPEVYASPTYGERRSRLAFTDAFL